MSIQDDLFDLNDHLEGGDLQDAWDRVVEWAFTLERRNDERVQKILDLEVALKVLREL